MKILELTIIASMMFIVSCSSRTDTSTASNTNTDSEVERAATNARNAVETAANKAMLAAQNAANQAAVVLPGKRAMVITENANLRKYADSKGEVIQTIAKGTNVEWVEQKGAWFSIRIDGKLGWMHGNTIRLLPQTPPSAPTTYTPSSSMDSETSRRYDECVKQRTAFGVDTSPCSEWAKER